MQSRRRFTLVAMAWLAALPLGCATIAKKQAAAPRLSVLATLEAETFRPGEAVVCTVKVTNEGDAPAPAGSLSAETLEFWFGPADTDLRYRREPVRSSKEKGFEAITIAPRQSVSRRFVLTRLTEEEGRFALHVLYSPQGNVAGKPGLGGPAFLYQVDGQRLFRRDENGLIRKEDAIEVAKREVGGEVADARAKLVRNEAGFLDWLVTAEVKADGRVAQRAFFINPYTGAVRVEARPDAAAQVGGEKKRSPHTEVARP